ncbi:MAG: outer membrane protein assembly factor BamA, partial [Alphaproteobacteria bacterium]|nr:outer membrane protein assembly factor BamA [Alphaproteobacteria bacterium]
IKNNTRTYENVIRRNLAFDEQDIFSTTNLRQSEQNLMGLGYFDSVQILPRQVVGTPDKVNIDVNVKEKSTGELSLGAGWSSLNKGFFEFGIKENNFMGKGQTVGFTSTFSGRQNNFSLSFVEPYMFDRDLMGGVDAYYNQYRYNSTYGYNIDSIGLGFKLGWNYTDNLSHRLRWSAKNERMTDISSDLPAGLLVGVGDYNVFRLGQTLIYRDQIVDYVNDTKNGYVITLSNDYAGFGGDKYFVKNDLTLKQSFSFWDNEWMFGILVNMGKIHSLKDKVLSRSDRYLLGGDNLRGFEYGGVGARSSLNPTYAYGGDWVVNGTFQLNFPIGIPKKYKVSGYIFYDWGKLGSPDLPDDTFIMYSGKVRTSTGYGILWNSPIGAINLSWAKALKYESYDDLQRFRFSIGSSF